MKNLKMEKIKELLEFVCGTIIIGGIYNKIVLININNGKVILN